MMNESVSEIPGHNTLNITARHDLLPPAGQSNMTPLDRSIEKRRLRKHYILNIIRQKPGLSRAEISKAAGMNLPSVSTLIDELLNQGLAYEEDARRSARGRRPTPIYLQSDAASVLGIDIGKHSTMAILMNLGSAPITTLERLTPPLTTTQDYADWAITIAESIFEQYPQEPPPLCGIGVALPGLISETACEDDAPDAQEPTGNIRCLSANQIKRALKTRFGVEALVDNDARIMVPGAHWFHTDHPTGKNFVVFNIGLGMGIGVCENGRILSGTHGFSGELGHSPLGDPDILCYCGNYGCLENVASGLGIQRMAQERGLPANDVQELADLARDGGKEAQAIFKKFASALGRGIAVTINLYNPETVILSGKVSMAADVFIDDLKAAVARHTLQPILERTRIHIESPQKNLSSLGAVAIVFHSIFYSGNVSFAEIM